MPTNHTPNYQLSQWERSDKIQMEDFNADNAKIDGALKTLATQVAGKAAQSVVNTLSSKVNKCGNCAIEILTYTGTGTYGENTPTVIRFSVRPDVFIMVAEEMLLIGQGGVGSASGFMYSSMSHTTSPFRPQPVWSGSQISFTSAYDAAAQVNLLGRVYLVIGLRSMG